MKINCFTFGSYKIMGLDLGRNVFTLMSAFLCFWNVGYEPDNTSETSGLTHED